VKKPRLVEVKWIDAHFDHTLSTPSFADEIIADQQLTILENVGYYVGKTKDLTIIASSIQESVIERPGQYAFRDIMSIPTMNVVSIKPVGQKTVYVRSTKGGHGKK
jgi:hypothetical protein